MTDTILQKQQSIGHRQGKREHVIGVGALADRTRERDSKAFTIRASQSLPSMLRANLEGLLTAPAAFLSPLTKSEW